MTPKPFVPEIIFFDIDDTLSRDGVLAKHNKSTLEQLAKTDIKLAIATGRSKSAIPDDIATLFEQGILDAIVCANGQYNFIKDRQTHQHKLISHYPLSQMQKNTINSLCSDRQLIHKFDSATHMAWVNDTKLTRDLSDKNKHSIIDPEYFKTHDVYQCSVLFSDDIYNDNRLDTQDKIQDIDLKSMDLKLLPWHVIGGDILPFNGSKARGITDVCQYLNIEISKTMAFGDGFNDYEMFDLVECAVAMGDAQPSLKEHADLITGTMEDYGIQDILKDVIKL